MSNSRLNLNIRHSKPRGPHSATHLWAGLFPMLAPVHQKRFGLQKIWARPRARAHRSKVKLARMPALGQSRPIRLATNPGIHDTATVPAHPAQAFPAHPTRFERVTSALSGLAPCPKRAPLGRCRKNFPVTTLKFPVRENNFPANLYRNCPRSDCSTVVSCR
jgi:hypothetical protein